MRVAIIIPYFGKFPVWFELYLYSCSKNPQVDFIFFTDCELPQRVYDNTIFYKTDFESYCKRVSDCLSIDFRPKTPYKLCDLKPFYGIIHQIELEPYDFWGFGDIDLIYGDLSIIVNEKNLKIYDFITTHSDRIAGHFTIMKKDTHYTKDVLRISNWKERLIDEKHYALDEVDYAHQVVYPELKWVARFYHYIVEHFGINKNIFFSFANNLFCNKWTKRLFKEYYTTPLPGFSDKWFYNLQTNTIKKSQGGGIPYLHFLFFKRNIYLKFDGQWDGDYYFLNDFSERKNMFDGISISLNGIMFQDQL